MANLIKRNPQTAVTWLASGGTEVLTLTSLANGDGRAGEEHDFGDPFNPLVKITFETKFAVAPTAGEVVNIWWSASDDGTDYDGECTGSDAAYNDENQMKRLKPVGALVATNDTNAQRASWVFALPARWGVPVVSNQSGQALSSTAADHSITVIEIPPEIQ